MFQRRQQTPDLMELVRGQKIGCSTWSYWGIEAFERRDLCATGIAVMPQVPALWNPAHAWFAGPRNVQLLHLVNQRGALQAKLDSRALRSADYPVHCHQRLHNQSAFRVPEGGSRRRGEDCAGSLRHRRQRIGKHSIVGKNHGTFNQILELTDVSWPGVGSQGRHRLRPNFSAKCSTSAGMSSRRARKGGRWTGKTLRR
jgi:hypothetical protein